jgi:hypothetical protein
MALARSGALLVAALLVAVSAAVKVDKCESTTQGCYPTKGEWMWRSVDGDTSRQDLTCKVASAVLPDHVSK